MNKVSLKKVTREHAEALQTMVAAYIAEEAKDLQKHGSVRFHSAIQLTALSWELYFDFRKKVEGTAPEFNMLFRIHHAVTLLYACVHAYEHKNEFIKHTALVYSNKLDEALKAIPIPYAPQEQVPEISNT